jgi:hypothetical protein
VVQESFNRPVGGLITTVARPTSCGSGNGQLSGQRWSKAQKLVEGALTNLVREHHPLNLGTMHAVAATGRFQ